LVNRNFSIEQIRRKLMFQSDDATMKYIHAYVWWKKSGLGMEEWSKFHHAYIPRLVHLFGYDPDKQKFSASKRKEMQKGGLQPEEIDEIVQVAARKEGAPVPKAADFDWFVNLIKGDRVTDCRQCDGIVSPALFYADQPYGEDVLRLLQEKPKKGEESPAEKAWSHFNASRRENHLTEKTAKLAGELQNVLNSRKRLAKYLAATPENTQLRGQIIALVGILEQFRSKLEPPESDAA